MKDILGIILFFAGVTLIAFSKQIATRAAANDEEIAKSYSLKVISETKWNSPYMRAIARAGTIFVGIILILSAYVTIFGTIDLR